MINNLPIASSIMIVEKLEVAGLGFRFLDRASSWWHVFMSFSTFATYKYKLQHLEVQSLKGLGFRAGLGGSQFEFLLLPGLGCYFFYMGHTF